MPFSEKREVRVVRDYIDALNARDIDAVERILGEGCMFIDSRGDWVSGRDRCIEASLRFFALSIEYRLDPKDIVSHPPDILVRGRMLSSDPRLARDRLWRARSDGEHLLEWQSFASGESLGVARLLMPDVANDSGMGGAKQESAT